MTTVEPMRLLVKAMEDAQSRYSLEQIIGTSRKGGLVKTRHAIMRELRAAGLSYPTIGRLLRRHHATVIYAIRRGELCSPSSVPPSDREK